MHGEQINCVVVSIYFLWPIMYIYENETKTNIGLHVHSTISFKKHLVIATTGLYFDAS